MWIVIHLPQMKPRKLRRTVEHCCECLGVWLSLLDRREAGSLKDPYGCWQARQRRDVKLLLPRCYCKSANEQTLIVN